MAGVFSTVCLECNGTGNVYNDKICPRCYGVGEHPKEGATKVTSYDYLQARNNGISKYNVDNRIKIGWPKERAITEPVKRKISKEYKK